MLWARLLLWLVLRTALFYPFFETTLRVTPDMPAGLLAGWVWVVGLLLFAFNCACLQMEISKGAPWRGECSG